MKGRKKEIRNKFKEQAKIKSSCNEYRKNTFNVAEVIIIMIITALFGILIGSTVTYFKDRGFTTDKNLKELIATYNSVIDNYYKDIDSSELLEAGIKGMIDYLGDPYSVYLDPESSEEFNEQLEGEYTGLGAEISLNIETNILMINKVFKNTPAEKCGLQEGDIISKVDGKEVTDMTIDEVSSIIKNGEKGTIVKLNVKRKEEELEIKFERGIIEISSVTGEVIEKNNKKIGLITIELFAKNTYKQFKEVYLDLEKQGVTSLIVDVRNNTGGYLVTVKSIAEMFLDKNDTIFIIKNKDNYDKQLSNSKKIITIPTAVLINGGSASASEVLAAALKENENIELIGLNTYGKGTVQKTKILSSGATIKYTIEEWLTPNGKSIEKDGIKPTIEIEQSEKYYKNPTKENDTQLQKAVEIISKK